MEQLTYPTQVTLVQLPFPLLSRPQLDKTLYHLGALNTWRAASKFIEKMIKPMTKSGI